ncbi:MAG: GlmU family protein [Bacteroidota bacterium]
MQHILFEDKGRADFLPFTYTRPVYELRCGIFSNIERWAFTLQLHMYGKATAYLQPAYPFEARREESIWINGRLLPNNELIRLIGELPPETYVAQGDTVLLARSGTPGLWDSPIESFEKENWDKLGLLPMQFEGAQLLEQLPCLFQKNAQLIRYDFSFATQASPSQGVTDPHSRVYGQDNIYVAEGVKIRAAVINAEDGPVYIGPNSEIQEGSLIKGTHALVGNTTINMGAKLRGDSTFGPHVKVGGEIANSVIMGYSNKGHEGYLGNSVLGYWCNLGADTNTSNLKNNYAEVKLWHYPTGRFKPTGTQFCGLMMGDHSKCGINTMFNTGTVVGVGANIFGADYPRNFIPSFSWGGTKGMQTFKLEKMKEVAKVVMSRRKLKLTAAEEAILASVYETSAPYRRWETK